MNFLLQDRSQLTSVVQKCGNNYGCGNGHGEVVTRMMRCRMAHIKRHKPWNITWNSLNCGFHYIFTHSVNLRTFIIRPIRYDAALFLYYDPKMQVSCINIVSREGSYDFFNSFTSLFPKPDSRPKKWWETRIGKGKKYTFTMQLKKSI